MEVPWIYVRSLIAREWFCAPPDVDEYPAAEIQAWLRLRQVVEKARRG